jgi:hypothetical protein
MVSERLIDNLRDGQAVKVGLAPDRLDPAALDVEGWAFNTFQVQYPPVIRHLPGLSRYPRHSVRLLVRNTVANHSPTLGKLLDMHSSESARYGQGV